MSRKLKALGLTATAVLAMSAIWGINANATTGGHFTIEVDHVILTGEQVEEFKTTLAPELTIGCGHTTFEGTEVWTTHTEMWIAPVDKTCTTGSGAVVHARMNGCRYYFTIHNQPATKHNTTHIVCPGAGIEYVITNPFGTCTVKLTPQQTPTGGAVYTTGGSGKTHDFLTEMTMAGIHATFSGGFFACGTSTETTANASITGSFTARAYNTLGQQVALTAT